MQNLRLARRHARTVERLAVLVVENGRLGRRHGEVARLGDNALGRCDQIQHHGGWRSSRSLDPYVRRASLWSPVNAASRLIASSMEPDPDQA